MPTALWSYKCEYCGSLFKSYKFCDRHELACNKNPNGKNCIYCEYGWSKSLRKRTDRICPKSGKRFGKHASAYCEHFVKIDRKEKFKEASEFYKSLGDKKNGETTGGSFEW